MPSYQSNYNIVTDTPRVLNRPAVSRSEHARRTMLQLLSHAHRLILSPDPKEQAKGWAFKKAVRAAGANVTRLALS